MQRNRRTALWYNYRAYPPELRIHPRLAKSIHSLEALREHEATRLLLAGLFVGLLGGLGAVVFDAVMSGVGELVLGTAFPAREAPVWWRSLLGPTLIGLLVGYLVQKMTHRGRPQGIADVLARVQLDAPSLSFRDGMVSAFTAALAVGSGFSGGREGPIVQFASTLAAKACQILGVRPSSMRTLVAAGAAAGIAASFNTPLGGAFFALEIILGNFAVENFAPVVVGDTLFFSSYRF
ncbi:MAG TPA: chloride channel protein, partial [Myxococcota bacterium]|nr:chloride channel protein [Myxococcota bacterium]